MDSKQTAFGRFVEETELKIRQVEAATWGAAFVAAGRRLSLRERGRLADREARRAALALALLRYTERLTYLERLVHGADAEEIRDIRLSVIALERAAQKLEPSPPRRLRRG